MLSVVAVRILIYMIFKEKIFGMPFDCLSLNFNNQENAMRTRHENRWYCNKADRKIAGVCSGLARAYGHNATLIRCIAVLAFLTLPGVMFVAYLAAALILPSRYVV
jgi:phage shock protein C